MKMQDWLKGARKSFNFDEWPHPPEENAQVSVRQLILDLSKTAGDWRLEKRLPWGNFGYVDYFRSVKNDRHRVMVRISEYGTHDDARMALLEEVSFSSAPTLPRLDELGIEIGDVGFTGHGDVNTGITFVRRNILADVRSIGEEPVSVREFTRFVDNYIIGAGL
ncbi:hypothetical protein J2128_002309 [Methanomicrobium sp. W14]|uniref:hypothetical protein n=1 Tax=Methanomicrobium sp. W14 TaxID=2817839 RepID=UPI001AE1E807|nr:hypothetical protein [Methanomicrobium sp. W14]MBP2134343.1 hypothetical protein [Methanomicrobium sp. W14]